MHRGLRVFSTIMRNGSGPAAVDGDMRSGAVCNPAALSGSLRKATGFAGTYLVVIRVSG